MNPAFIVVIVVAVLVVVLLVRTVRVVPQATAGVVERFGRYHRTLSAGYNIVVPFVDRLRPLIDLREQVVSFPPQSVSTSDHLVVSIDTVMYYRVTDAKAATYEVANFITAIEQLTVTRLRDVVGRMDLDRALGAREEITSAIHSAVDEKSRSWGIQVNRVEVRSIDPPPSIQDAMERERRADRESRAAISSAEGEKQSAVRSAEGEKQAAILRAEGDAEAQAVRARGQSESITTLVQAIHREDPDNRLLAYQYIQMLPQIAQGASNKLWIVPSEMGKALEGLASVFEAADGARGGGGSTGATTGGATRDRTRERRPGSDQGPSGKT